MLQQIVNLSGTLDASPSQLLGSIDEELHLLELRKQRSRALPGDTNMPALYIGIDMDLNSYVTRGQPIGSITSYDDTFGLKLPQIK